MPAEHTSAGVVSRLRTAIPVLVVLATAVASLGLNLVDQYAEQVPGLFSPVVYAGLVAAQALALVFRRQSPATVFVAVVILDSVLLGSTGGQLGTGSLGVMIATYSLLRTGTRRYRYAIVSAGAVATVLVSAIAMVVGAADSLLVIVAATLARPILQYGAPAALAEFLLARERLVRALRERAELAERQRVSGIEREMVEVRTAMARELHDIAAHHLSGIIVGAQAASALAESDPARTREMLRTVQQDARTTLADLRRTVGLLRSDNPDEVGASPQVPSLARIPALVETARSRQQSVELTLDGQPRPLGPLAETAGYRMVQESLANAAQHAPGATCHVQVEYLAELVRITVDNEASASIGSASLTQRKDRGYGISGMDERAGLVGGRLETGPRDGGWRNRLEIPYDRNGAAE
ncbi:MAG TPA: histidine kinase [Glaciihabitans sp.]|jgi:signal transduction histidine kinase|nr:histidine kinase [Glaciihabitans sp.]